MAKKFAEITGIHKIFSVDKIDDGIGNSEDKYNTTIIDIEDDDIELQENIDKNTIVFVTADDTDVNRIIGPNNYKISKDDCFIIAQNKVYATFGKVNVSDVMGPTGEDGETPEIGDNGNWVIGGVDTGVHAQGPKGDKGDDGKGIETITKTSTSGLVDTYTISYTEGEDTTFTVTNGAPGQSGTSSSMPVGSVIMFAGDEAPDGWVFCKGQVIPTSDNEGTIPIEGYEKYKTLISVIKDSYCTSHINQGGYDIKRGTLINIGETIEEQTVANLVYLPDFSLRFPYGASDTLESSYSENKIYGGESSVLVPLPAHTHTYSVYDGRGTGGEIAIAGSLNIDGTTYTTINNTGSTGISNPSINIIPKYTMINFIIKYE